MASNPHPIDVEPVRWRDGELTLLDQRRLPEAEIYLPIRTAQEAASAIKTMVVRGAPAIGVTAAYGVVLSVRQRRRQDPRNWHQGLATDLALLASARPTAVNLGWALARMRAVLTRCDDDSVEQAVTEEAETIQAEDLEANRRMGKLGAALLQPGSQVLTHCNAGALATAGYGTALGVIRHAFRDNRISRVYADETRPWLQGARLTAWELLHDQIPVTLIADAAAAQLMSQGSVNWVIVGADRIAANGDVANKIGTYSLAVNARHHGVKFMVVAPISTIDPATPTGADIPIEQRDESELLSLAGQRTAPAAAQAVNPVFDVTPAALIDVLVTERGVLAPPTPAAIAQLLAGDERRSA